MTAEPIRNGRNQSAARVTCDACGHQVEIRAKHETHNGHDVRLPGHYLRKLNEMGWSASSSRHTCPACVTAARASKPIIQEEPEMTAPTDDMPKPTREQKREIIKMLDEVYDTKVGRYTGEETDKTVAHALGIERWGWVSEIRKELYGDGDDNEAKDNLIAEAKAKLRECDALGAILHDQHDAIIKSLRDFNDRKRELAAMLDRMTTKPTPIQKPQLVAR